MSDWDKLDHSADEPAKEMDWKSIAEAAAEFMPDTDGGDDAPERWEKSVGELKIAVDRLVAAREVIEAAKESEKDAVSDVETIVNYIVGVDKANEDSTVVLQDGRKVIVTRKERWEWSQEVIAAILGDHEPEELPDFIRRSTTISRPKFEALPIEEQRKWHPALTRKSAPPKIEVKT